MHIQDGNNSTSIPKVTGPKVNRWQMADNNFLGDKLWQMADNNSLGDNYYSMRGPARLYFPFHIESILNVSLLFFHPKMIMCITATGTHSKTVLKLFAKYIAQTFLDSKTHVLFPSSSTLFHHLKPTSKRPVTFFMTQKSKARSRIMTMNSST